MFRAMLKAIPDFLKSSTDGRSARAVVEIALFALGAGILFYVVDVLSMRWQGLSLH